MLCDICGGPPDLSEGAAVPVGGVDGGEDEVGRALQHVHGDLHNHGHDYMDIFFHYRLTSIQRSKSTITNPKNPRFQFIFTYIFIPFLFERIHNSFDKLQFQRSFFSKSMYI